jgi:hypothetical protein
MAIGPQQEAQLCRGYEKTSSDGGQFYSNSVEERMASLNLNT